MSEKYDKIGVNYDLTRKADLYISERIFFHLSPTKKGKYLDIGCGTGNYTIEFGRKEVDFIGVDPSAEMLKSAKAKTSIVDWKVGNSENIPLGNESVDGVMASLTIHHWNDLRKSFCEINRVLKSDGRFVIFTSTSEQMKGYWLNHYFPQMLKDSLNQMPRLKDIENNLINNGFEILEKEKYFIREDLEDLFLYSGKHNPSFYLESSLRQGISSFSNLANSNEIESGLGKLESDIKEGKIQEIVKEFVNKEGDYLFLSAKK